MNRKVNDDGTRISQLTNDYRVPIDLPGSPLNYTTIGDLSGFIGNSSQNVIKEDFEDYREIVAYLNDYSNFNPAGLREKSVIRILSSGNIYNILLVTMGYRVNQMLYTNLTLSNGVLVTTTFTTKTSLITRNRNNGNTDWDRWEYVVKEGVPVIGTSDSGIKFPDIKFLFSSKKNAEGEKFVRVNKIERSIFEQLNARIVVMRPKKRGQHYNKVAGFESRYPYSVGGWKWAFAGQKLDGSDKFIDPTVTNTFDMPYFDDNLSSSSQYPYSFLSEGGTPSDIQNIIDGHVIRVNDSEYSIVTGRSGAHNHNKINTSLLKTVHTHSVFGFCVRINNPAFDPGPYTEEQLNSKNINYYRGQQRYLYGPITKVKFVLTWNYENGSGGELIRSIVPL